MPNVRGSSGDTALQTFWRRPCHCIGTQDEPQASYLLQHTLENFFSWIWKMELFLRSTRTPADEYFATAIFYLSGDADRFAYDLVRRNGGEPLSWEAFKRSMRERYCGATFESTSSVRCSSKSSTEDPCRCWNTAPSSARSNSKSSTMSFEDRAPLL